MLGTQLVLGTLIIIACVVFHVSGLLALATYLKRLSGQYAERHKVVQTITLLVVAVFGIILLHSAEAWAWAFIYVWLGEFADLNEAVYFSVVTATTLGYGDLTLSPAWRFLGSFEAMGGLILFGASTAFFLGVMKYLFDDQISDNQTNL